MKLVLSFLILALIPGLAAAAPQETPEAGEPAAVHPRVALQTTQGKIVVELYPDKAPKTVENFLEYVRSGHYDGTIFHRVIPSFMIQLGGYTPDLQEKPTREPIQNESDNGLSNERGTLAMARRNNPHSATAQFYINLATNPHLDHRGGAGWGYTVFGRVVEGMDVVDAIAGVSTSRRGVFEALPDKAVIVEKAVVE